MALVNDTIIDITKNFLSKAFEAYDATKSGVCIAIPDEDGSLRLSAYDVIFSPGDLPKMLYDDRPTIYAINKELLGKPGYGFNMIDVAALSAAMNSDEIKTWIKDVKHLKVHYTQPYFDAERTNGDIGLIKSPDSNLPYIFSDIVEDETVADRFWTNTVGTIVKFPALAKVFVEGVKYLFQASLYDAIFMFNYAANITFKDIVDHDGSYGDTAVGDELVSWHAGYDDLGKALRWLYRELFDSGVDPIPFIACDFIDTAWAASSKDATIAKDNMLLLHFKRYKVPTPYSYNLSPQALFNYLKMVTIAPELTDVDVVPYYDATYNKYESTNTIDHQKDSKRMLETIMMRCNKHKNISPFMEDPECVSFALEALGYHNQGVLSEKMRARLNTPIIQIERPKQMYSDQYKIAKQRLENGEQRVLYTHDFEHHLDFIESLMELMDLNPGLVDKDMDKTYMIYWLQEMFTTLYVEMNDLMRTANRMLKFCEKHPTTFKIDIIPAIFRAETFQDYFKKEICGTIMEYDPKRKELITKNAYKFMQEHQRETINDYIHNFIAPFAYEYNTKDVYKGEMTDFMFYISATDTRLMRYYILNLVNCDDISSPEAIKLKNDAIGAGGGKKKYPTIHLNSKVFLELFKYTIAPMLTHAEGIPKKYAIINISDIVYCQDFIEYSSQTKEDTIRQRRIDTENNILAMAMYYLAKGDEYVE